MIRILGIDPGSRITGYGIVEHEGNRLWHLASGCIRLGDTDYPERLRQIFTEVSALIKAQPPDEVAIERVFMNRNVDSALKLGHARGAAIVACSVQSLPVYEYSANEIKQALVGRGHASKTQIQHMVKVLLDLRKPPQADAADALAVAVCHIHTRSSLLRMAGSQKTRAGRIL